MKKIKFKPVYLVFIMISLISLIIGMAISTISFFEGFKKGNSYFANAVSAIKDDPYVEKAMDVQKAFRLVAKTLMPSVVNISTETVVKQSFQMQNDPFFEFFGKDWFDHFFNGPQEKESIRQALGTGVIIDEDGFILTNFHVVQNATKIKVKLSNGKEYKARVIGTDPRSDLALLKIDVKEKLTPAPIGDSDEIEIGDWGIAIGNPFALGHTFTVGIISAKGRSGIIHDSSKYENYIQTDAAINPGNSGGPLVNIKGEVVGINTAIATPSGGNVGIGFAIPINMAKSIFKQLKETGRVSRGYLGVNIQDLTPKLAKYFDRDPNTGVLISDVMKKSPAGNAGLKSGDIILEFDGKKVKDTNELRNVVAQTKPGNKVEVLILRDKKEKTVKVKIGELPDENSENSAAAAENKNELWMGIKVSDITSSYIEKYKLDDDENGVIITFITPGSETYNAGLRTGDVIKKINNTTIKNQNDFKIFVDKYRDDDTFLFIIKKEGRLFYLSIENDK
ncbi:MAG: DegQ family serine endoprotease [Spirochaetes bacterium]|nr:DegQ family serine endoprotease [Spirochaetota bacterium]